MDINNFFQSKIFRIAIICISVFVALFLVFGLGVYTGFKKADFSFRWAEQYHNNFAGPKGGFFQEMAGQQNQFMESNGAIGKIIQIRNSSITVQGRNDIEKIISITQKTTIKYQNGRIGLENLKVGDEVVIIGNPTEFGQIEAMLVRVMPAMPQSSSIDQALPSSGQETQQIQQDNSTNLQTN
jgi:hypothetical protein